MTSTIAPRATGRRGVLLWLAAGAAIAIAAFFAYGKGFPNTDATLTLTWGRELLDLESPTFDEGTTPHPLTNLLGILGALAHPPSETLLQVVGYAAAAALILGAFAVGRNLFGTGVGVLAALLVATRDTLLFYGALAYVDVIFAALVVWAVALEAARPRRGVAVLVLLAIAGLARPEAWVLSGLYWLYARPDDRRQAFRWAALVASAPLFWIAFDWVSSGDPFLSYNLTKEAAGESGRPTGFSGLLTEGPRVLARTARPDVCLAAVVGLVVAFRASRLKVLGGAIAAVGLADAAQVVAGTALEDRYLLPMMALLCIAAAAPLWLLQRRDETRAWRIAGGACLAVLLVGAIIQAPRLQDRRDSVVDRDTRRSAAHDVLEGGVPCYPLVVPHERLGPVAANWLDVRVDQVRDGRLGIPRGSYLWGTQDAMKNLLVIEGRPGEVAPRPSAPVVRRHAGWTLMADCPS